MMILSMSGQAALFLSTVALGFLLGFVYDLFRIARKTVPHRPWVVQFEDILFWLVVTLLMFYFMLHRNYGEIRFFSIAGAALGVVIYFCSLSPLVMKVSVAVVEFFKKVLFTVARIILTPIRWALKLIRPPLRKFLRFIKRVTYIKARDFRRSLFVILKKV